MSDYLVKLIDTSILPASLMVVSKFLAVVFVSELIHANWRMAFSNNSFIGTYPLIDSASLSLVSNISDVVMLCVVLGGFVLIAVRALYFHETHINPRIVAKLASLDLLHLIKNSSKIYYSGLVWFVFSLIAVVVTWINIVSAKTNIIIGIISIIVIITASGMLIKDVENEIERAKKNLKF